MGLFTKLAIRIRFRNKSFGYVGNNSHFKTLHSKFHNTEKISIGSHVRILDHAYIEGLGGVEIGDGTIIAPHCTIMTANHIYDETQVETLPFGEGYRLRPVSIGRGCWLARSVTLLPGAQIGDGCIVGAGSVVSGSIPDFSIVAGNPAKIIRSRDPDRTCSLLKGEAFFERSRDV